MTGTDVISLRFPASDLAPGAARHEVVRGLALEGTLAADVALLVSEAVTNSVLHAGLGPQGVVHVDARCRGGRVRVEVCDEGRGLGRPSPAGDRHGGFGLDIIGSVAECWGLHTDGHTRIWFELTG